MPRTGRHWSQLCTMADEEVQRLLRTLPRPLAARVRDVPVSLQPAPTREQVADGVDPDLMGLFLGDAWAETEPHPGPTQILLFLENIWEEAEHDPDEYRRQVRDTLLHEIGHYLGLEEDGLIARDLE